MPFSVAEDARFFGPSFGEAIRSMTADGLLRTRGDKHYWAGRGSPSQAVDVRSSGGIVSIYTATKR